jgi:hypothetical protein
MTDTMPVICSHIMTMIWRGGGGRWLLMQFLPYIILFRNIMLLNKERTPKVLQPVTNPIGLCQ